MAKELLAYSTNPPATATPNASSTRIKAIKRRT
jgi:hypothetical protein